MSALHMTEAPAAVRASLGGGGGGAVSVKGASRGAQISRRPSLAAAAETYLAIGVVAVVALLILPLPPFMLDMLLALSFALSIIVLLVTVSTRDPLEFSIFPSLLLLITLFRLGLNVSSTRLILSQGHAGKVIAAFGNFVIGGNVVVGLVIFLILVVINFIVITKGAGRIAEVAARFTLDAMPGRQMSIDADLGAGLIDESEARRRRDEISRYADFYGSMDGAAKFVRGDAVAGLVITLINLIGGFIIGMTQRGLSAGEALTTYSSLTVGDGLVTQIPALIVSTAAGMLVTYGSTGTGMGSSIGQQLTRNPRAIWTAGAILGLFALVPGLPAIPFLMLAGVTCGVAYQAGKRASARQDAEDETTDAAKPSGAGGPTGAPPVREILAVEPLEMEIGYGLVPLVDEGQRGDLLQRIGIMRKQLAFELGMIVPSVRIRDNIQLGPNEYVIKLRGARVAGERVAPAPDARAQHGRGRRPSGGNPDDRSDLRHPVGVDLPRSAHQRRGSGLHRGRTGNGALDAPDGDDPRARVRTPEPSECPRVARRIEGNPSRAHRGRGPQSRIARNHAPCPAAAAAGRNPDPRPRHHPRIALGRSRPEQGPGGSRRARPPFPSPGDHAGRRQP